MKSPRLPHCLPVTGVGALVGSCFAVILMSAMLSRADAAPTAFVNVGVVSMLADEVSSSKTVVVDGGRISVVGDVDTTPIPPDAVIVDGTDRFLLPGLTEMHAHLPGAESPQLERVLTLFLANGVTQIRGMLGDPSHLKLRDELASQRMLGPRLTTAGPALGGRSVAGSADAEQQVRSQFSAGYDFIKIQQGLTSAEYEAIVATATELGIPFAGHVPAAVGVEAVLAAGQATIDHLDGYLAAMLPANADASGGYGGFLDVMLVTDMPDASRIEMLARQTAAAGTWNVPTQALFERRVGPLTATELAARAEMRYMPAATITSWTEAKERQVNERGFDAEVAARAITLRRQFIHALHEAGARLILGSDAPQVFNVPGFSVHQELDLLTQAGLTPYEALATATTAAAEFLGTNTGTVAPGRDADLLLLDASPLDDITNSRRIHGVMLRGTWYSARELDALLAGLIESDR